MFYGFHLTQPWAREGPGVVSEPHKSDRAQFHRTQLWDVVGIFFFHFPEAQCNIRLPLMLDRTGLWVERRQTQEKVLSHRVPGAVLHSEECFMFGSEFQRESRGSSVGTV